jgi:hypothetical protein
MCIGCFGSPDGWVSAGTVSIRCLGGTHHTDAAGLDGRVPGVPIGGCCWWCGAQCSNLRLDDRRPDRLPLWHHDKEVVRPYVRIQTWANVVGCRRCWRIDRIIWSLFIHRLVTTCRWARVSNSRVLSSSAANISDPKMSYVPYKKFTLKVQGVIRSPGWILSTFSFLVRLCQHISIDICDRIGRSSMIIRSISDELDARFRLIRTL